MSSPYHIISLGDIYKEHIQRLPLNTDGLNGDKILHINPMGMEIPVPLETRRISYLANCPTKESIRWNAGKRSILRVSTNRKKSYDNLTEYR